MFVVFDLILTFGRLALSPPPLNPPLALIWYQFTQSGYGDTWFCVEQKEKEKTFSVVGSKKTLKQLRNNSERWARLKHAN